MLCRQLSVALLFLGLLLALAGAAPAPGIAPAANTNLNSNSIGINTANSNNNLLNNLNGNVFPGLEGLTLEQKQAILQQLLQQPAAPAAPAANAIPPAANTQQQQAQPNQLKAFDAAAQPLDIGRSTSGGPVGTQMKLIDAPLADMQWADEKNVFVLTESGRLYRSEDSGRNWKAMIGELQGQGGSLGAVQVDPATGKPVPPAVEAILISPADPNYIFVDGMTLRNWVSKDMGRTYRPIQDLDIRDLRMHPKHPEWLLAMSLSRGCPGSAATGLSSSRGSSGATGGTRPPCFKSLWLSRDFGGSWRHLVDYVVQFDWAPAAYARTDARNRGKLEQTIYATVHAQQHGDQQNGEWSPHIHLYSSSDFFATRHRLVPHGNRFLFAPNDFLFVATVDPKAHNQVSLLISRSPEPHIHTHKPGEDPDDLAGPVFQKAILPVQLTQHSYTVLDASEGSVFLHVNHRPYGEAAASGHVYVSDWSGLVYSLSLPHNHRDQYGKCDFESVEGLEGIFIANFVDPPPRPAQSSIEQGLDLGGRSRSGMGAAAGRLDTPERDRVQTVITFDKGARWSYLPAPTVDSLGRPVVCPGQQHCSLHLHGVTDEFGPVYSSASATGIIMGTGNVGRYLSFNPAEVNTYLSRDAGYSWTEVRKGSRIYELGDHGGLIVMADDLHPTNTVEYSWDEGRTWNTVRISEHKFLVENIVIEPAAVSQQFIVYGMSLDQDAGYLVHLDLDELHQRICVGHDEPDKPGSDYETWTPNDGRIGSQCLMGHTTVYTRRKAHAACFNPEEHQRSVRQHNCACTADDFQCDYGYEREVGSSECRKSAVPPIHENPFADRDVQCAAKGSGGTYRLTRGYRRIPGNTCVGGELWDALEQPCPRGWVESSSAGRIVFWALLFAVIGLALVALDRRFGWWTQFAFWMYEVSDGRVNLFAFSFSGSSGSGSGGRRDNDDRDPGSFWRGKAYRAVGASGSVQRLDADSFLTGGFEEVNERAQDPTTLEEGSGSRSLVAQPVATKESDKKLKKKTKKLKKDKPSVVSADPLLQQPLVEPQQEEEEPDYMLSPLPQLPQLKDRKKAAPKLNLPEDE